MIDTKINYSGLRDKEEIGISFFVSNGYRQGVIDDLHWSIRIDDENAVDEIAEMLTKGFTAGFYPDWQLTFKRYSMDQLMQLNLEEKIENHALKDDIPLSYEESSNALALLKSWTDDFTESAVAHAIKFSKQITSMDAALKQK